MDQSINFGTNGEKISNYCLAFIDLLGQREAMRDQQLLKIPENEEENDRFLETIKASIVAIYQLQKSASGMLDIANSQEIDSQVLEKIPKDRHEEFKEAKKARIKNQRWSDGLVTFTCLSDKDIACKTSGVFNLIGYAGVMCLMGLMSRQPVRGAIEIAWGVELHDNEIYGPVVMRAYELESEVAQYPRIVVGEHVVRFLEGQASIPEDSYLAKYEKRLANACLSMLMRDMDGHWIVHYLGDGFQQHVSKSGHMKIYELAQKFVNEQYEKYSKSKNSKLAFRYFQLVSYFTAFSPKKHS